MKKKILVYMETDTNDSDTFIKHDIIQELSCCSCFYEDIDIRIFNIEDSIDENKVS